MSDKRRIGDHVQCECGHVWLYDGAVRDCPKCDSKDNFWLTVAAAGMNDRYAPLWHPGDQVADTDGMAAAWDDARMYGSGFVLNGERIDPALIEWPQPSAPLSWDVPAPRALSGAVTREQLEAEFPKPLHNDWPAVVPSRLHELARRVEELEAERDSLRLRIRELTAEKARELFAYRLSATWEHLPDVTAPVRGHAALFRAIRK